MPSCHLGCASTSPQFTGSPSTSTEGVVLVWDEPDIMDPLVLDRRYALYTMCDGETTPTFQSDDLQGPSYTISGLPTGTQCTGLVVMYSRHCERNLTGPLVSRINFTAADTREWTMVVYCNARHSLINVFNAFKFRFSGAGLCNPDILYQTLCQIVNE